MDRSLFPARPKDFMQITITPVVCRPVVGSFDQFIVAALCSSGGRHRLERANVREAVRRLYTTQSEGVVAAIDIALADLFEATLKTSFAVKEYRFPVSNMSFDHTDLTEGPSLRAAGERWLRSMSSMHLRQIEAAIGDGISATTETEVDELNRRVEIMESMAEHPDSGLWRFWNAKALELAAKLRNAQDELRLTRATEEAALAVIGVDRPEAWKQGYVQETYAQEFLDLHADRVREAVVRELGHR